MSAFAAAPVIKDKIHVLHEAADFTVFSKPSGISIRNFVELIRYSFWQTSRETFDNRNSPHSVHRLDAHTSGCVIISADPKARGRLCAFFRNGEVEKTYLAIVVGKPDESGGTIHAPLKVEGSWAHFRTILDPHGKPSETRYKVLASNGEYSLLSLKPITGRPHQLRVHCASVLKTPILGDPWYNSDPANAEPPMFLHAHHISIPQQTAAGVLTVTAPLPRYIESRVREISNISALGKIGLA